jgi:hypothetical protein
MRRLAITAVWLALNLLWVATDRLPRDGDEEGHVGAAELFRAQLQAGDWLGFVRDAFIGDLGEYPPLFPALVGGWWHLVGAGQPGQVAVRGVCLIGLLLAAWATGRLAGALHGAGGGSARDRPYPGEWAELCAFSMVLALPLANGLARHFMPEGLLVGVVALAIWRAWRLGERPSLPAVFALGVVLGLGLLVKQTFILYALLPVIWAGRRAGGGLVLAGGVAAMVAGPWYGIHWAQQLGYGQAAAGADPGIAAWAHAVYYPAAAAWIGVGPVLLFAAVGAAGALLVLKLRGAWPALALAAAWGLGGAVLLTAIPKKYPRLMAPLTPAAALVVGVALAHTERRRLVLAAMVVPAWGVTALGSQVAGQAPRFVPKVDQRCLQRWLRAPVADDLGLARAAETIATAPEGTVVVRAGPEIPCELQTTHPWTTHLSPYLRREGLEREVKTTGRGAVVIDWSASAQSAGDAWVPVPSLGAHSGFALTVRGQR